MEKVNLVVGGEIVLHPRRSYAEDDCWLALSSAKSSGSLTNTFCFSFGACLRPPENIDASCEVCKVEFIISMRPAGMEIVQACLGRRFGEDLRWIRLRLVLLLPSESVKRDQLASHSQWTKALENTIQG